MPKKHHNSYVLYLYHQVDDFVNSAEIRKDEMPHYIVSFCTFVERILKIKMYKKNPVLVFDLDSKKENYDDILSAVALRKTVGVNTSSATDVLKRYGKVFPRSFNDNELEAIDSIFKIRNHFIHGCKSDSEVVFDKEETEAKIGTVWEELSRIAISVLGKERIKKANPKKKYSQKELEEVLNLELEKEVKTLIDTKNLRHLMSVYQVGITPISIGTGNRCPRCGNYPFEKKFEFHHMLTAAFMHHGLNEFSDDLYKCDKCNLELTDRQYEIAKRIISEEAKQAIIAD